MHRSWIVTVPASEHEVFENVELISPIRYICGQLEKGSKTGYHHFQLYVELDKGVRMKQLKRLLKRDDIHCEGRRGTRDEARNYCMKPDTRAGEPFELGVWIKGQGHRSDLDRLAMMVKEEKPFTDIFEEMPGHTMRFMRHMDALRSRLMEERANVLTRETEVIVLWGEAGSGKTRYVYDNYNIEDIYSLPDSDGTIWFDGYRGQSVLLIDDFYGGIKYSYLLKILDRYPLQLQVKGSFTWAMWTTVIITSNEPPANWYKKGLTEALERRLTEVKFMCKLEDKN